jgi:hypothetical protein
MSEAEWLHHLQRMAPDVARVVTKIGLVVNGEKRFPPRKFAVVPPLPSEKKDD